MWRLWIAALTLVGAAWLAVAQPWAARREPAHVVVLQPTGNRLYYPAGRYPVLTLPNGQKQVVRSLLNVGRPMHYGEYRWDVQGVPAGPAWVRVDLSRQTLSVFRGGHEIGSAVIIYGTDGKPTPLGVFPVLEKDAHHLSSLYDAEMPYMLRLTGDGVAIHASNVTSGHATHGCVGVPPEFARLLFDQIHRRDPVAIIARSTGRPTR